MCEDFPACGHESGCCPDFDESGKQLNMVCVCGAKLPVNNPSSICNGCLRFDPEDPYSFEEMDDFDHDEVDAYDDNSPEWESDGISEENSDF